MADVELIVKPNGGLTQKAYLNALAALLDYGSRLIVGFVVTPFLLSGLGTILFGAWQVLTRLVGNVGVADGRPAEALKWVMTTYQDSEDDTRKRRVIGSALTIWIITLPLLIVVAAIAIWFSPTIAGVTEEFASIVRMTAALLTINVLLAGLVMIPESVLKGMNLGYKRMGLVASVNILAGGLTILILYLGYGILTVAGIQILSTLIVGLLFLQLMRRYLPWFGFERATWSEVKSFFSLSVWYTSWSVVKKLLMTLDVILLGLLTSAVLVTDFVLTSYVVSSMVAVIGMMVGASVPGLGKLLAQEQYDKVVELRHEMMALSCLISIILGAQVLLWNRTFLSLWVGSEHFVGLWANFLIVLIGVQFIFIRNETYMIDLTLDVRRKVLVAVVAIIVILLLSIILVPQWGIIGLCISVLVGRSCLLIAYPIINTSYLQVSLSAQIGSHIRPVSIMLLIYIASLFLSEFLQVESWIALILGVVFSLPILALMAFFAGFSYTQRTVIVKRLRIVNPVNITA